MLTGALRQALTGALMSVLSAPLPSLFTDVFTGTRTVAGASVLTKALARAHMRCSQARTNLLATVLTCPFTDFIGKANHRSPSRPSPPHHPCKATLCETLLCISVYKLRGPTMQKNIVSWFLSLVIFVCNLHPAFDSKQHEVTLAATTSRELISVSPHQNDTV